MNIIDFKIKAREVMDSFGLNNWAIDIDNCVQRLGACIYNRRTLSFSKHFILQEEWESFKDTVLHEIAHALVGPGHGHGYYWKMKARYVGAKPERCASVKLKKEKPYILPCLCEEKTGFYRLTDNVRECQYKCRKCNYVGYIVRNKNVFATK